MRNIVNETTIKLLSRSFNESFARSAAASFVMQLDPTLDELADIKTAVSEAVTNSIVHGYKEKEGYITINIKITDDRTVIITVKDKGCGIENIELALTPLFTTGDSDRSGMGFTIMESFTDRLSVTSKKGQGTTVKMEKKLKARYGK